jgi:hypothetical protein
MMDNSTTTKSPDGLDKFLTLLLKISIALLGIITLSFLFIPFLVLPLVNKKLKNMPDFGGNIKSIRLNLFDASVTVMGISLIKKNLQVPVMFFSLDHLSISLRVFKRKLLADISVDNFNVNLVKGVKDDDSQLRVDKAWIEMAKQLLFLNISRLQINNGSTHFRTYHTTPPVDIFIDNIKLVAEDLNIRSSPTDQLPADLHLSANIHGGILQVDGTMNPRNPVPTFDINAELQGLNLAEINSLLLAYADIDVSRGTFSMSSELAAKERKISGYVKPVVKDLKLFNWKEDKKSSLKKMIKELFIDGVVSLFKNQRSDQLATKVVIDGEITGPDVNLWSVVGCMLCNAFVESLLPHVENSISIDSVGNVQGQKCGRKPE